MAINRDSLLELAPLIRAAAQYADGAFKSERHFLDFVVDGQSLWEALAKRHDKVSVLCVEYAEKETANAIRTKIRDDGEAFHCAGMIWRSRSVISHALVAYCNLAMCLH